ncbi:hypothetical protein A3860_00080 [Niastella vici]|uniref:Uncharacterized protein n=1 Tax=Niastella vici TaxID=1703345 RepID=A0A1V9G8L1_9BACT|nr:hypothetical protein [Niastella vici]OQP66806.1 hypothetical protein A3860_00080 [Niastella vici]
MYVLLFLFGAAAFGCYVITLVSLAMGVWEHDRRKIFFGLRFLLWAVLVSIAFMLIFSTLLNGIANELGKIIDQI